MQRTIHTQFLDFGILGKTEGSCVLLRCIVIYSQSAAVAVKGALEGVVLGAYHHICFTDVYVIGHDGVK